MTNEYRSCTRCVALSVNVAANSFDEMIRSMAAASDAGSAGGTRSPASPSKISSGPPLQVATTGTPQAIASTHAMEKPSV